MIASENTCGAMWSSRSRKMSNGTYPKATIVTPQCLSTLLHYYTLILYTETDEGTVTTSGVCIFTHFEEIMWGCIKMYCRWKGIFIKSHEHVTELLYFFTWAQWTMFWTEVPAGQCVVYTGVLVWKIKTNTLRNIPKSTEIKEHNSINA